MCLFILCICYTHLVTYNLPLNVQHSLCDISINSITLMNINWTLRCVLRELRVSKQNILNIKGHFWKTGNMLRQQMRVCHIHRLHKRSNVKKDEEQHLKATVNNKTRGHLSAISEQFTNISDFGLLPVVYYRMFIYTFSH